MPQVKSYAAQNSTTPLAPFDLKRREPGPRDILIDIAFCGVCHSDLHQVRNEWGGSLYPMVPGHEIVGTVKAIGAKVTTVKIGQKVGVGCLVNSCQDCGQCHDGFEQFCEKGMVGTYSSKDKDGSITQGGYSQKIIVDEKFVLKIPDSLPLDAAAPLLCAGITTYSPLRHWKAGPGKKVAVVGLGGLGHMAVKLGAAMGAEVTVLSHSMRKESDAIRMGAKNFAATSNPATFENLANTFDLIINTVSAESDLNTYLQLLKRDGSMVLVGVPSQPASVHAFSLISNRRSLSGSLIGGIQETQEMLDFCGKHGITSDIEVIPMQKINEAYERMLKSDVKYRFVIDMATL